MNANFDERSCFRILKIQELSYLLTFTQVLLKLKSDSK